jgi:uncharacterized membrane protein YdbT with pleckstrin-like domain
MAEQPLWSGTSSQIKNLGVFALCILIVPIPWAFWRWLKTRTRVYELTSERLLIKSGILNKNTETLELYRVRDMQVSQPLLQRIFGLQTIHLITSDSSTPQVSLDYLPTSPKLDSLFREHIEKCRMQKRVREIDLE